MSRDFLVHVLLAPENNIRIISNFEIFASHGAPPVSMTSAANFATDTAGVVDNGGKFATGVNNTGAMWQIMGTISDC